MPRRAKGCSLHGTLPSCSAEPPAKGGLPAPLPLSLYLKLSKNSFLCAQRGFNLESGCKGREFFATMQAFLQKSFKTRQSFLNY